MPSKALENYLDNIIGSDHKIKPMTNREAKKHLITYYTDKAQEDADNGIYPDQKPFTGTDKMELKVLHRKIFGEDIS